MKTITHVELCSGDKYFIADKSRLAYMVDALEFASAESSEFKVADAYVSVKRYCGDDFPGESDTIEVQADSIKVSVESDKWQVYKPVGKPAKPAGDETGHGDPLGR